MRDWVLTFNAQGPEGLIDGKALKLNPAQRQALAAIIGRGPDPERDGIVRGRPKDLAAWLCTRFGVSLDESTLGRTVKKLGFRKLSARPRHHAQDPAALAAFQKAFPPR